MQQDYQQLISSVRGRINPENFALKKSFSDELATISYSKVLIYVRLAMKSVEPEYTQKSKNAGERVKEHLNRELENVSFRYQGSVMTNTHIRGYSDIDLLTISDKFYSYDASRIKELLASSERRAKYYNSSIEKLEREVNTSPYLGNSIQDLRDLRNNSENILRGIYSVCDTSKPKAIKIKNLSLNREVDIVIANWYDDISSIINNKGDYRGIQIYNKASNSKENPDYPFLSIKRINERSSETNGRLKKMIRFLKNSKANSNQDISLTSFDINAICYDISPNIYKSLTFYELVPIIYNQMKDIVTNDDKANNLVSVDGRDYIFRYHQTKRDDLSKLLSEIEAIFIDLKKSINV
ncbi:nucleotidyltransferase family protein [Leeuwenhoekiella nanhaiensis]|uniref:cGAS/DncV-like nucleotidyltransferase C-terminal helical domain-containing protein n=1 Tax=Leeuwenhoekiella nanhaiensis TaxID=1655491 RepID=A0A2G1VSY5_9FLAO|nr:nucleotidyltransferase domain-containing protein [Leeuwenhoekiella nanhaiensis]PHQ29861.1 hypothetical protein CJ305_07785 [Leeuwenhoekiella nanhaiensis]